ncbi:hypothetical protein COV17_02415 [Candidatus Woesearchaeota archaeon CG10_big_fil_rev_8_21_14_0_10_36_11]|nr:MAG: hypothetical protein COV17_02415 [Candidatus Woesearchaeota archaeon CG10_big_fil_rev_8_21_14_0_10_36_11]
MKPKLLLVADTYYPKVDGTLIFMEEFIKRTHRQVDISLLVPNFPGRKSKSKSLPVENVRYVEVSKRITLSEYPSIKLSFKNLRSIQQEIKKADIVFIQGPALLSYLSIYYAHKYSKKTFFYLHVLSWDLFSTFLPPLLNKLFRNIIRKVSIKLYNRCSEILVPYRGLKDELTHEKVHVPIGVAKLGVDIQRFLPVVHKDTYKERAGIAKNTFVIGYVGRVSKEKNVGVLLSAFTKLISPQSMNKFHLLIVGDGPRDQTKEFRENGHCTITGFVDNVQEYLKAMDVFVMPSLTETTSLATLEAMSTGLPVIATKVGFIQKYIAKNHNGMFFPKNSPTMLAMKIEKLRKDPELRTKLGRNARNTVAYSFSWERSINKIKRLLLEEYYR